MDTKKAHTKVNLPKAQQKTGLEGIRRNALNAHIRKNILKWIIKAYTLRNERGKKKKSKNNPKEVEENKKIRPEIGDIENRKSPWNISKINSESFETINESHKLPADGQR